MPDRKKGTRKEFGNMLRRGTAMLFLLLRRYLPDQECIQERNQEGKIMKKITFDLDAFTELIAKESGKDYTSSPYSGRWTIDNDGNIIEIRYNKLDEDANPVITKRRTLIGGIITGD
jgi:hypothetical protein